MSTGIPNRHASFKPADSKSQEWTNVYNAVCKIARCGGIIALCGGRGAGKTQLGVCLVNRATSHSDPNDKYRKLTAQYIKAYDFFLRIREAMKSQDDSERAATNEFIRPYLLVIDALEVSKGSDYEYQLLDHVIDKRYDNERPTLIISNDTPEVMSQRLGPSIIDRMRDAGGILTLKTPSFRGTNKKQGGDN
jgi:DNA replication protein DnaC